MIRHPGPLSADDAGSEPVVPAATIDAPAVVDGDVPGCPHDSSAPTDRRAFMQRLLAVAVGVPASAALAACGDDASPMGGSMAEGMPGWMMMGEDSMGGQMMRDMRVIRDLLVNHDEIQRRVHDTAGGVRTVTTSSNRQLAERIQTHVWQMKQRVEHGDVIRQMDPLFRELFEHHAVIRIEIENVDHGVQVTETSNDPQVALLIRQHARRAVSEFVADGMTRAMQPTPLPDGYRQPSTETRSGDHDDD